jgi:hypothetical protein
MKWAGLRLGSSLRAHRHHAAELRAFSRLMAERPGPADAWCDPLAWQWRRVAEALDRWHAMPDERDAMTR